MNNEFPTDRSPPHRQCRHPIDPTSHRTTRTRARGPQMSCLRHRCHALPRPRSSHRSSAKRRRRCNRPPPHRQCRRPADPTNRLTTRTRAHDPHISLCRRCQSLPTATIVPSKFSETDHPLKSSAASPSMSAPNCVPRWPPDHWYTRTWPALDPCPVVYSTKRESSRQSSARRTTRSDHLPPRRQCRRPFESTSLPDHSVHANVARIRQCRHKPLQRRGSSRLNLERRNY